MLSKFIGQEADLDHRLHLQVFSFQKFIPLFVFETRLLEGGRKFKGVTYCKTTNKQVILFGLK